MPVVRRMKLDVAACEGTRRLIDNRPRLVLADELANRNLVEVGAARLAVIFGDDVEPIAVAPDATGVPATWAALIDLIEVERVLRSVRVSRPCARHFAAIQIRDFAVHLVASSVVLVLPLAVDHTALHWHAIAAEGVFAIGVDDKAAARHPTSPFGRRSAVLGRGVRDTRTARRGVHPRIAFRRFVARDCLTVLLAFPRRPVVRAAVARARRTVRSTVAARARRTARSAVVL